MSVTLEVISKDDFFSFFYPFDLYILNEVINLNYLIREMPDHEKPRERLLKYGPKGMSQAELLAIILQTGSRGESVIDLSKRILYELDRPSSLLSITIEELMTIKGVGIAKACKIVASLELYRRLFNDLNYQKSSIKDARDVYLMFEHELSKLDQEHFYCLYLDTKQKIIAKRRLFVGSLTATIINPRDVFKYAIRFNAPFLIFIHNHPSGDPTPSDADIKATHKLVQAASELGLKVIDHVVIGKKRAHSILYKQTYTFT